VRRGTAASARVAPSANQVSTDGFAFISGPHNVSAFSYGCIQKSRREQEAVTEPVVHQHGREAGHLCHAEARAVSFNSLLGGPSQGNRFR